MFENKLPMQLTDLPNEILLTLLSTVPLDTLVTLTFASHRLRRIATDASLWSHISLVRDFSAKNAYIVTAKGRSDRVLERPETDVQVKGVREILGVLLGSVLPVAGPISVRAVNVKGLGELFQDSHLAQIARWCPHLETLNVSGTSVTEAGIHYLTGSVLSHSQSLLILREGIARSRDPSRVPTPPRPPTFTMNSSDFCFRADTKNESYAASPDNDAHARDHFIVATITQHLASLLPGAYSHPPTPPQNNSPTPPQTVTPRCPHLRHLHMSGTRPFTDAALSRLARAAPHLHTLDLTSFTSSSRIADPGLSLLAACCPSLAVLRVGGCSQVTDAGILALCGWRRCEAALQGRDAWAGWTRNESAAPGFEVVEIGGCFQVTSVGVAALMQGCERLRRLDVGYCWRVGDGAFVGSEDFQIVDPGLRLFEGAERIRCTGLQSISIRFCYLVTDAGIFELGRACKMLEKVDVTSCPKVTRRELLDDNILHIDDGDGVEE
ncbi:hypothetical protein BC830DRAFT_1088143 [Chytriomyces sp. MP71]|nr:hypothetical protein BC830DRAFT_1088143 [Chytriomyces sp. MP71]